MRSRPGKLGDIAACHDIVASPRYARTRKFYEQRGFHLLEEIDPYPGWDPGNPCAIYVKVL